MRMRSRFTKLALLVLVGAVAGGGCKRAEEKVEYELAREEAAKPLPKDAVIDPLIKAQRDIALEAQIVEGNRLHVSVRNKTKKTIVIGPKNLAVLRKGENKPVPFDPDDTGFPITKLTPDSEQIGMFRLRGPLGELSGGKILFNHPEVQPSFTYVK